MTYRDALDYILSFTNFEVTPAGDYSSRTFDLARIGQLLTALGDPQQKFQSVHVAGTKGKGSTAAMIESILRAAGYLTGFYTSPHLHTFRERIRVRGDMISRDEVVAGVARLKPLAEQIPGLTTFEIMTALAFDHFASHGIEIAVLEVGLGGRLDATNVVIPRVAVITSISYDHTAILGDTLAQIAREKAGIIKPGVPVVSAPQRQEALRAIQEMAHTQNAPLVVVSPEFEFQASGFRFQVVPLVRTLDSQVFAVRGRASQDQKSETQSDLKLGLLGRHQLANATTALAAISVLREGGIPVPQEALRTGFAAVAWPGRLEILSRNPFVIVDGAHNGDSAHQLIVTLRDLFPHARLHFVFGASNDKDIDSMFGELLPAAESLILTRAHNRRAADLAHLAELAARYNVETSIAPNLAAALGHARERAHRDDVVCVTGSLFVVAEARAAWFAEHGTSVERDD